MKRFLLCLLLTLFAHGLSAQNSIDALVERYYSTDGSTFTSAVERDPATRRVIKMVKVLKVGTTKAQEFKRAFTQEARKTSSSTTQDGERYTIALTVAGADRRTVYLLQTRVRPAPAQITIVTQFDKPASSQQQP